MGLYECLVDCANLIGKDVINFRTPPNALFPHPALAEFVTVPGTKSCVSSHCVTHCTKLADGSGHHACEMPYMKQRRDFANNRPSSGQTENPCDFDDSNSKLTCFANRFRGEEARLILADLIKEGLFPANVCSVSTQQPSPAPAGSQLNEALLRKELNRSMTYLASQVEDLGAHANKLNTAAAVSPGNALPVFKAANLPP